MEINAGRYAPAVAALLTPPRRMPLDAGAANDAAVTPLEALDAAQLMGHGGTGDVDMAQACLAGLWLYHDHLDNSHQLSQRVKTTEGDYWHGLVHRREGDHGNAKYWFRRVGAHPIHAELLAAAGELAGATPVAAGLTAAAAWDAAAFVDLCAAAKAGETDCEAFCRDAQQAEWSLLFDHCYRRAVGGAT